MITIFTEKKAPEKQTKSMITQLNLRIARVGREYHLWCFLTTFLVRTAYNSIENIHRYVVPGYWSGNILYKLIIKKTCSGCTTIPKFRRQSHGVVLHYLWARCDLFFCPLRLLHLRSTSTFKNPSWLILAEKWSYIVVANKAIDICDHLIGKYFVVT